MCKEKVDLNMHISYAEKVNEKLKRTMDLSKLPTQTLRRETPTEKGIEFYKFTLVGRIDLQNLKIEAVRKFVKEEWALKAKVSPLGRGYNKVFHGGPSIIQKQLVRFSKWSPNFSVKKYKLSSALVWVRFP
ncbi:hypothetical protein FRX31_013952 [Thalictrum thalictroides]|uniref:Uncharacterized protein n=1 Tax=Thalictrum thalictroides TaxID=46969 RepID=A0A7J6WGK9_THATH|nr:hypothetical protein FRX31_013952 [Thalictrum thalictroides]